MQNRGEAIDKIAKRRYNMDVKLLSVDEVANTLGVSRATVYRLIRSKKLSAKKLGSRTVFTISAITDYINSLEEYEGDCYV